MNKHVVQFQLARHQTRRPTLPRDYLNYDIHPDRWKIQATFNDIYDKRFKWWEEWYQVGRKLLKGAE